MIDIMRDNSKVGKLINEVNSNCVNESEHSIKVRKRQQRPFWKNETGSFINAFKQRVSGELIK